VLVLFIVLILIVIKAILLSSERRLLIRNFMIYISKSLYLTKAIVILVTL